MSSAELVHAEAGELDRDPVAYMAVVLNRAKGWLAEASNIENVREAKAIAVGYESVIREKELAFDAQLAATEIVRRCERRIGELVREGQAKGTIRKRGEGGGNPLHRTKEVVASPSAVMGIEAGSVATVTQHYAMADAPTEQFEQALSEAREEGNLSRANVVRKVRGERPAPKARSAPTHDLNTARGRNIAEAHRRRLHDMTATVAGYVTALPAVQAELARQVANPDEINEWCRVLRDARRAFRDLEERLSGGTS